MDPRTTNTNSAENHEEVWATNLKRFGLFIKRRIKLNRFLLVIDTKKGVGISAITVIVSTTQDFLLHPLTLDLGPLNSMSLKYTKVVDLIDLLWNLSMAFGPLTSRMSKY